MKTCYNCGAPISKETCEGFPELCEHWIPKKPITNADKFFRNATDEEIAGFIYRDPIGMFLKTPKEMVGWLRAPAEEG